MTDKRRAASLQTGDARSPAARALRVKLNREVNRSSSYGRASDRLPLPLPDKDAQIGGRTGRQQPTRGCLKSFAGCDM
jgi:hypothetical protein